MRNTKLIDTNIKVTICGTEKSGKTSVVQSFCNGTFSPYKPSTIGIDFYSKVVTVTKPLQHNFFFPKMINLILQKIVYDITLSLTISHSTLLRSSSVTSNSFVTPQEEAILLKDNNIIEQFGLNPNLKKSKTEFVEYLIGKYENFLRNIHNSANDQIETKKLINMNNNNSFRSDENFESFLSINIDSSEFSPYNLNGSYNGTNVLEESSETLSNKLTDDTDSEINERFSCSNDTSISKPLDAEEEENLYIDFNDIENAFKSISPKAKETVSSNEIHKSRNKKKGINQRILLPIPNNSDNNTQQPTLNDILEAKPSSTTIAVEIKPVVSINSTIDKNDTIYDFINKAIDKPNIDPSQYNESVKVNLYDTSSQNKYSTLVFPYYKLSDAVIVLYDVTDLKSYDMTKKIVQTIKSQNPNILIEIVGNKIDLIEDKPERTVALKTLLKNIIESNMGLVAKQISTFIKKENINISDETFYSLYKKLKKIPFNQLIDYMEISAKKGLKVETIFNNLLYRKISKDIRIDIENFKKSENKVLETELLTKNQRKKNSCFSCCFKPNNSNFKQ